LTRRVNDENSATATSLIHIPWCIGTAHFRAQVASGRLAPGRDWCACAVVANIVFRSDVGHSPEGAVRGRGSATRGRCFPHPTHAER